MEKILVIDFGSQYTQLIARRLRELSVYSEVCPWDEIPDLSCVKGFILSGGPESSNIDYKAVSANISPVTAVSNYEYETIENEKKREIELMKPQYLQQFLNDMRNIMYYEDSSSTVNPRLSITDNTRLLGP